MTRITVDPEVCGGRIEINPRVMLGKPVIKGTRVPADLICRKLREGASDADLLDAYPPLTIEDVRAARRCGAQQQRRPASSRD